MGMRRKHVLSVPVSNLENRRAGLYGARDVLRCGGPGCDCDGCRLYGELALVVDHVVGAGFHGRG